MKISILLPYKENFSPVYAGAVSLYVNDTVRISKFVKNIVVYGNTNFKKIFNLNYKNIPLTKISFQSLSKKYGALLIADKVQSGFGRTGDFFAFQKHKVKPDIITIAKGMGNGFPVGGILVSDKIKEEYGLLGSTFGGNHLACSSSLAVLNIIEQEKLMRNANKMDEYFRKSASKINGIKVKGRGLMLGLEFNFEVKKLRDDLVYKKHIFTGGSSNKNLLRILPPLNVKENDFDKLFKSLKELL